MLLLGGILFLSACQKNNFPAGSDADIVQHILQKNLNAADMRSTDLSTLQSSSLRSGHHIYRLSMGKENIVLETDGANQFVKGAIYTITGSIAKNNGHTTYSGVFDRSDLGHKNAVHWSIDKGFALALHCITAVATNGSGQSHVNYECADCTLPEVTVSASYPPSGGIDWFTWMSLLSMFDMGSQNDYLGIDWVFGGSGGSSSSAPVVTIDQETSENKTPIDIKKYLNCFGTVPDNGATCAITISTDIPMDGHPEQIFDWTKGNPGHAFIELYKAGANGSLISQNFGLYPSIGFLALTGLDIPSKMVDNAGHEYNARYTISVTPSQFQAAINTANNIGTQGYNIATFNCTDFALAIFNAAGGGLTIPGRQIPGFPNGTTGSNTPQGLYQKLDDMKAAGTSNIDVVGSKAYGGTSHGPCN